VGSTRARRSKGASVISSPTRRATWSGLLCTRLTSKDRDGGPLVLASIRFLYPWLRHIFADSGYAGAKLRGALRRSGRWTVEIIKRSDTAKGFEVLPRRWVVERTFAWLNRLPQTRQGLRGNDRKRRSMLFIAHIRVLTRKLARL